MGWHIGGVGEKTHRWVSMMFLVDFFDVFLPTPMEV